MESSEQGPSQNSVDPCNSLAGSSHGPLPRRNSHCRRSHSPTGPHRPVVLKRAREPARGSSNVQAVRTGKQTTLSPAILNQASRRDHYACWQYRLSTVTASRKFISIYRSGSDFGGDNAVEASRRGQSTSPSAALRIRATRRDKCPEWWQVCEPTARIAASATIRRKIISHGSTRILRIGKECEK